MFAVWGDLPKYTIVFNANGGTGEEVSQVCYKTQDCTLKVDTFSKVEYSLLGWSIDSSATSATYTNGQVIQEIEVEDGGTVTLYAIWESDYGLADESIYVKGNAMYNTTSGTGNFTSVISSSGDSFYLSGGKVYIRKPVKSATISYSASGNKYGDTDVWSTTGVTVYLRRNGGNIASTSGTWNQSYNVSVGGSYTTALSVGQYFDMYVTTGANSNCTEGSLSGGVWLKITVN